MSTIRAVTFDCWGTLITDRDMTRAVARRVQAIVDASGGKLPEAEARELMDVAWRTHHDAWVSGSQYGSEQMARFCVETLGAGDGAAERLCLAFEEAGLEGDVEALPGARESLRRLRDAGVRTALVCDTGFTPGRLVRRFLHDHDLADHLEFLAFSNEVGVPKPHPDIFHAALDAIGAEPAQAAHVGDLRRTDVAGAKAVGMRTIRITAANQTGTASGLAVLQARGVDDAPAPDEPEADEIVSSHDELIATLARMGAPLKP